MIEREVLERCITNVETQTKALLAVIAGGRSSPGNSFDFNNLTTSKKNLEGLLAALPSKETK